MCIIVVPRCPIFTFLTCSLVLFLIVNYVQIIMLKSLRNFSQLPTSGGIILFICVVVSLILANSPLGTSFERILNTSLGFETDYIHLRYSVSLWINRSEERRVGKEC